MALQIGDFASNLTAVLGAITQSQIYTDIRAMYDDRTLQKDQYDKILIAFHEKALEMAGVVAQDFTLKAHRLDEIIDKDLAVKTEQIASSIASTAMNEAQNEKDLLVKQANADLTKAQEQAVYTGNVLTNNQSATEVEKKKLIIQQRIGFDDNTVIERVKIAAEAVGLIQSGGNTAPAEFLEEWIDAVKDLRTVAQTHEQLPY
jgi:hypothetical protein